MIFGYSKLGYNESFSINPNVISEFNQPWKIDWYYKDGALKKSLLFGIEGNIKNFEIELNERIQGAVTIEFNFIDFLIHMKDIVEIFYRGVKKYTGYISSMPDSKGGKINIDPRHTIFDRLLYNGSFENKTLRYIFKTIVQSKQSITGIIWNDFYVDIDDETEYSFDYNYENCKKIFDDLKDLLDDTKWGANENNIFVVYQDEDTVTKIFDNQNFISVETEESYDDIDATKLQVFQKDINDDTVRIGEVGYGGDYPTIALEEKIYQKEGTLNIDVPDLTETECLDFAYSKLTSLQSGISGNVKGFNLDSWFPQIGKKIKLNDKIYPVNFNLLNCKLLTADAQYNFFSDGNDKWDCSFGALALDSVNYINNSKSIKYTNTVSNKFWYDFENGFIVNNTQKINIALRSNKVLNLTIKINYIDKSSTYIDVNKNNYVDSSGNVYVSQNETLSIIHNVSNINRWLFIAIPFNFSIVKILKIEFSFEDQLSSTIINIGNVSMFADFRNEIEGTVKKAKIKIDAKNNKLCNITLNKYNKELNNNFFRLEKKIKEIEAISQSAGV